MIDCKCVKRHMPPDIVDEDHHILPLSWGGQDTPENKVKVCAQTHFTIHFFLNAFVRAGKQVPRERTWPAYAYKLALQGWESRLPGHNTPFWLPASGRLMSADAIPFTKEFIAYHMQVEVFGDDRFVTDLDGNRWKVGRFDVPTQCYWCIRAPLIALPGGQ